MKISIKKENSKIILLRENLINSILTDISTFSFLVGSFWFNYKFIGNSHFSGTIILIMFLFFIMARAKAKEEIFTNKETLIKYLNKLK